MKTTRIYSVKDELTQTFLQPVFVEKEDEILRIFTYQINNTPIWKDNASDFSLYYLGTFDSESGTIIGEIPKKVISGHSVRRKEQENDI